MMAQPKLVIPPVTQATAAFSPPIVRPGEQSILSVTFNALEESVEWPTQISAPAQLQLQPDLIRSKGPTRYKKSGDNPRIAQS